MKNQIWAANPSIHSFTGELKLGRLAVSSRLKASKLRPLALSVTIITAITAIIVGSSMYLTGSNRGTAATPPASKTVSQQSSPATSGCDTGQQNENVVLFAACPSFSLNFANLPGGQVNTQQFNVYNGKPEVNDEAEFYSDSLQNIRIANASLQLTALKQPTQGYNYTSARVDTKGKEDFQYGKLVVRATVPDGVGTWPAIWMLPSNPKYASLSPDTNFYRYLNDGEIDVLESVGADPHVVYGIAHSLAYPPDGPNKHYFSTVTVPDNATVYHDYELDWTPTNLTFSVDGRPFFSIDKQPGADYRSWPYDQQFYLILNLAVGGSWGGVDRAQFPPDGVNSNALPATMKVQSINYYPYIGK